MALAFELTGPPITEADVTAFETVLPGPLPTDYRAFLLRQNGGEPEENWWPPEVSDADFGLHLAYSLGDVPAMGSLIGIRETFDERIPGHFLAIACDESGNQLCLELAIGADYGTVWFFDHELEVEPDEEPEPNLLTRVCGSFTELLSTLEPAPDLDEMRRRTDAAQPGRGGEP